MDTLSTLNDFLSISNLKSLIDDVEHFINTNDDIDVQNSVKNMKKFVFDVMNTIYKDDRIKNMNLKQINEKTLRISKAMLSQLSKKTVSPTSSQFGISDESNRLINDSIIPAPTHKDKDVVAKMDLFIQERDKENSIHKISSTEKTEEFNNNQTIHSDEPMKEEDFVTNLEHFQQQRDDFNAKLIKTQPQKTIDFNTVEIKDTITNEIPIENDYNENIFLQNMSPNLIISDPNSNSDSNIIKTEVNKICIDFDAANSFDRTLDVQVSSNDSSSFHPKDFYNENTNINDIMNSRVMVQSGGSSAEIAQAFIDANGKKSSIKKITKTNYVLINSYDRNWIDDKFRYKYSIKFNNQQDTISQTPYFENNPTIPFTKSINNDGIVNTMGWIDKFGVEHDPYDSSNDPGEIIGYEDVHVLTDQDSNLSKFKDISSIKITNVTIPIEFFFQHVNSVNVNVVRDHTFNFNFPYILLHIDEFTDIYDGTDNTIRTCFCQLQYDNHFKCPNGRGYIILKPVQNESKDFYPTPLVSMPTLNISFTKPNGELLNSNKDGVKILAIQSTQTYYLRVTTTTFFTKDNFMIGDVIRFKNFTLFKILSSFDETNLSSFNDFINRLEGHEIAQIGEPNNDGYYNSFNIFAPGYFDDVQGKYIIDNTLVTTLTEFNNTISEKNIINDLSDYDNGYIINMSLQNSISMIIDTKEVDPGALLNDD